MDKHLIKEIYEFSQKQNIKSFHAVGFGISPSIKLIDIQDRAMKIKPEHQIILNTKVKGFDVDKIIMEKRFPNIEIVFEYIDSNCYFDL
jgi:hypothetical protein